MWLYLSLTAVLDGIGGQHQALVALAPERDPVHTVQEAWWAPGRSEPARKISSPPGLNPRNVQPEASCYKDYTVVGSE